MIELKTQFAPVFFDTMQDRIGVALIEDDKVLLKTYKTFIEEADGLFVTGAYTSFEIAEKELPLQKPDVILLDIQLPGKNGIEALPLLKKMLPKTHILILTVYELEQQIFNALHNGASGYLTKDSTSARIIDAIKEVKEGGGPMSMKIAKMVIKSFQKNTDSPLSKRETEILTLVMEGKKRNQIADALFIERETVKTHLRNIYSKLDVNSRADAIDFAKKNRLI
ncbi:MAG TPA: response regulator transcription factor [Mucilaginibacter sp.]|nr:response regulator transcription factor [Mucilaginibacter sp.]